MPQFYSKKVKFRKDIKPKHKTKIKVKNGFIAPYRYEITDEETGEEKKGYKDALFVLDYEVLEEGTDEEPEPRQWKKKEDTNDDGFNFSFDSGDDLPF